MNVYGKHCLRKRFIQLFAGSVYRKTYLNYRFDIEVYSKKFCSEGTFQEAVCTSNILVKTRSPQKAQKIRKQAVAELCQAQVEFTLLDLDFLIEDLYIFEQVPPVLLGWYFDSPPVISYFSIVSQPTALLIFIAKYELI